MGVGVQSTWGGAGGILRSTRQSEGRGGGWVARLALGWASLSGFPAIHELSLLGTTRGNTANSFIEMESAPMTISDRSESGSLLLWRLVVGSGSKLNYRSVLTPIMQLDKLKIYGNFSTHSFVLWKSFFFSSWKFKFVNEETFLFCSVDWRTRWRWIIQ